MSTEPEPDLAPEIAHVLLMDVVGYSRLLVDDQIELLSRLNHIVRRTKHFLAAESSGKLTRLPTGDGMALIFFDSPETPVRCALEVSQAVREHAEIKLRMGIHSGPVRQVMDVNDRANAAGAGIDLAQRVLDCGDAGHILVSQRVAEDLKPYRHWNSCLEDLGECEVKHGVRLRIFNLCKGELGNPALPRIVEQQRRFARPWGAWTEGSRSRKTLLWTTLFFLLVIGAGGGWVLWTKSRDRSVTPEDARLIPEKSVAVLPFANLSDDKQNAYFAEGVQDEILTHLARIADLKVISRTSVLQYTSGSERDLKLIARTLGVAHALEGSVQRIGNRVRITTQLVDTRTEAHLWAEHYDRDLSDVFAIQTEVAESVASALKARLSPQEKAAIEEQPTGNLQAYEFYVRGKALVAGSFNSRGNEDLLAAATLFDQAVTRDPNFFLAYYQLASAHNQIYLFGVDHTQARLDLADAAIKTMMRLRPNAGETHLALGEYLYWCYRDYERAQEQFEMARRVLPNNSRPVLLLAYIERRQGRFAESLQAFHRASELDPKNLVILQQVALCYQYLRRFPEMAATLDRAIAIAPDDIGTRTQRAQVDLDWRAETEPLRTAIESIIAKDSISAASLAKAWLYLALCQRQFPDAERALGVMSLDGCATEGVLCPRAWCIGAVARIKGDEATAAKAFAEARVEVEKIVRDQPRYAEALCVLGLIDAGLGKKDDAIREGKQAADLLPVSRDSINGIVIRESLALIYCWTGEKDLALEQLAQAVKTPGLISYGQLRLHPFWDPLRGDRRFDEIVASLAPKESPR